MIEFRVISNHKPVFYNYVLSYLNSLSILCCRFLYDRPLGGSAPRVCWVFKIRGHLATSSSKAFVGFCAARDRVSPVDGWRKSGEDAADRSPEHPQLKTEEILNRNILFFLKLHASLLQLKRHFCLFHFVDIFISIFLIAASCPSLISFKVVLSYYMYCH